MPALGRLVIAGPEPATPIQCGRLPYKNPYPPHYKVVIAGNHKPSIRNVDALALLHWAIEAQGEAA